MKDFIERLRAYSPQTRRFMALSGSAFFTGIVTIMWMVSVGASGTLAINAPAEDLKDSAFASSNMASIVEAFRGGFVQNDEGVTVVEEISTSTLEEPKQTDSTVIPF